MERIGVVSHRTGFHREMIIRSAEKREMTSIARTITNPKFSVPLLFESRQNPAPLEDSFRPGLGRKVVPDTSIES